jgi:DNA repair protein RadD
MISLRPYQQRAVEKLRAEFQAGRRSVLVVSPTGSGKGTLAAYLLDQVARRGKRGIFLVHRREIITDVAERIEAAGFARPGVILAGHPPDPSAQIQVASLETLRRRTPPPADLLIIDECHHATGATYQEIRSYYPGALCAGFTATPQRHDGQALGQAFDSIIVAATPKELIELGHLVPCDIIGPDKEAAARTIAYDPVAAYLQFSPGRLAVCYAATVRQAQDFAEAFRRAGVAAASVEGATRADERRYHLSELAAGRLRVIVNCGILTEGYDLPSLETCILARRIGSASLFLQCVGRVLRPAPGKSRALLLDLGGSVHTHGRPEAEREYTLDGKGIYLAGKREPLGVCPGCGLSVQVWPCTRCGHQPESRDVEIAEQPIALITENPSATLEDRHLAKLISKAITRGYKPGWVAAVYERLFGRRLDAAGFARVRSELSASPQWHAARAARERGAGGGETSLGEL